MAVVPMATLLAMWHLGLLIEETPLEYPAIIFTGPVDGAVLKVVPVDTVDERDGHDGSKQPSGKLYQAQTRQCWLWGQF